MKDAAAARAAALVGAVRAAALATLHDGAPGVSMTPYAILPAPFAFVVLVSGLAAHTRDMLADPRVALLVVDADDGATPPHALARVAVQAIAQPVDPGDARYAPARAAYLARFPDMTYLFELGDFRLFALEPASVRVVLGFAQATSLTAATFAAAFARD